MSVVCLLLIVYILNFFSSETSGLFLEDHPMNIPTIISSNLPTGFREEDKKTYNTLSNPCFFCAFPINKKHKLFIKPKAR
jgi:hypothetical protein